MQTVWDFTVCKHAKTAFYSSAGHRHRQNPEDFKRKMLQPQVPMLRMHGPPKRHRLVAQVHGQQEIPVNRHVCVSEVLSTEKLRVFCSSDAEKASKRVLHQLPSAAVVAPKNSKFCHFRGAQPQNFAVLCQPGFARSDFCHFLPIICRCNKM